MRRAAAVSICLLIFVAGLAMPHAPAARASHVGSVAAKKKCTIKKVHGKKKKVCKKGAVAPTPTPTSTPTATSEPANAVRTTPAFPGAPPGTFMAGASTTVTIPSSFLRADLAHSHQSSTQTVPGGTPIGPIDFSTGATFPIPGLPGSFYTNIVDLTITVADGRGFTVGQRVCFRDRDGKKFRNPIEISDGFLCAWVKSSSSFPSPGLPYAVTLTFDTLALPRSSSALKYIGFATCDELAVPVTSSTPLTPGEFVSFPLQTPSGATQYTGQVPEVDTQNGLIYLPFDAFLPKYNPLEDGYHPNQLLSPGSLLHLYPAQPQSGIIIGHNAVEFNYNLQRDLLRKDPGGIRIDGLRLPSGATLRDPNLFFGPTPTGGTVIESKGGAGDLQHFIIDGDTSTLTDLIGTITPVVVIDLVGDVLLESEAVITGTDQCLLGRTASSADGNAQAENPCATPTPTATSPTLFRYSFSGLGLSWTWQSPPSKSPQLPPGQVMGTACGSDPVTALWTWTIDYPPYPPFGGYANFAANNPAIISQPYDASPGTTVGTMTISLRLVPGPRPHMQLLAVGTGDATNIVVNPSDVAVQATPVSSCS